MAVFANLSCFNAGELSPKMLGRIDVSQYSKGCWTLKNFLVTPYGAAERRPGTKFVCSTKYADKKVRIIRFVYSAEIAYICEFGDRYIRFIRNGAPVVVGGLPLEITSPYRENDLAQIKYIQSADVMTIVHPDYPPHELKRTAEDAFTLAEKTYIYPPMLDPNLDDDHTLTPSALTGDITLAASKDTFAEGNIGGYFQLIHVRHENEISIDFTADGVSAALEVFGYWTFTTHGTWTGEMTIQRSFDHGTTWGDFRTYSSANDSNTSTSGEEKEEEVLYRLKMADYVQSGTGTLRKCRCLLVNPDFQITGVVKITAVSDARNAAGTVIRKLGGTDPTSEWNEGAWSVRRGFPCAVAFFEERMMFGGSAYKPQTVWGSRNNAWDDFKLGSRDDDGLDFTLASDTVNHIRWMCQHDALVIGTGDSEWTLGASDASAALTPSNFRVRRQSVYGSSDIPALMVGETILFVQRGNRKVREFVYSWEKDGYSSPDMTILADHITRGGIADVALQQLPDSILWCVLGDGSVAALTYEREQEVVGWHRHETAGDFLSVAVIPAGDDDRVYFAVDRGGVRTIEVMAPRNYADIAHAFFVDSGAEFAGEGISSVSGLAHLEGRTVQVVADGATQTPKTVIDGTVLLDTPADHVVLGLGYESLLAPMPIEIEMQNGLSVLRKKIIGELRIRVYDSIGGEARSGADNFQQIVSRDVLEDAMDSAIAPKDDVVKIAVMGGYETATTIEVRQRDPLPLNVTGIVATYEVAE